MSVDNMYGKRGQGLSTNAIILIILGVVVLVVLAVGFTIGWGNLKDRITGGNNNVDTIVQACAAACATDSKYDFCSVQREVKTETDSVTTDCATLSVISNYSKYGIEKCPSIKCDFNCVDIMGGGKASEKDKCDNKSEYDITSIAKVATGKKCCILNNS
jgi:hypothetical protein